MGMMQEGWLFNRSIISRLNWISCGLPTGLLQRCSQGSVEFPHLVNPRIYELGGVFKQQFYIFLTQVWSWRFIADPLDDFKTILSSDYSDAGDTGDEVLQRNTVLQGTIAQLQWAKFYSIAFCKASPLI